MQTCRNSQPMPRFWPRRSPVMRWPMPSIRPSFLMSIWISSPGCVALVADDRGLGVEGREPAEPVAAQDQADGGDRPAELAGDRRAGQALAAQRHDLGLGRLAQPARAVVRPRRAVGQAGLALLACRARHLRTVLGVTPKAAATAARSTSRQPGAGPSGVDRWAWFLAFWWTSIRRLRAGVACVAATTFHLSPGWTTSILTNSSTVSHGRRLWLR